MSDIDRKDAALLQLLQKNARLSNKELAAKVDLAQSSCLERVRRLEQDGVIRGYHADIAPKAVGIGLEAVISVRLVRHTRSTVNTFRAHLQTIPEVRAVYHLAGPTDFLVHVAVRDADHLRELALRALTTREEVSHLETSLVFEYWGGGPVPIPSEGL